MVDGIIFYESEILLCFGYVAEAPHLMLIVHIKSRAD